MTTLGSAPGGAQFIDSLVEAIKTLALLYASTPDARALPHLEQYAAMIQPAVSEAIGAGSAARLLNAFRSAVMTEKHRIESSGASRA
ncbi:MAG TPA: hypothetical protein VKR55_14915 [Bradyrhizobium sp.]|uniref:hypothetical protein n=1 Tax=Bradyrhizobium sp. TaxID=376 RepID=UPI002CA4E2DB|nr:hypothetical protein [Bradyrhizobium sp.]HLZ03428.1 hypothetical protein [Bradyrhizobium sp.]